MSKPSIEEAIKIAQEHRKELFTKSVSDDLNEAARFALSLDIRTGKHVVLSSAVYEAYAIWAEEPESKLAFFRNFASMFEAHKGKQTFYLLNYRPAQLLNKAEKLKARYE